MPSLSNRMKRYKCPCGRSYFTVSSYHDRAGQFDEHWEMNCSQCKQLYQLSSFLKETGGGINEAYMWAPINIFSELTLLEGQLQRARNDALALARELYLEQWLLHFSGANSKREIWRRLTDDGRREPGFKLFSQMVRIEGLGEYLQDYFHYFNLDYILKKLGVRSWHLDDMRKQIADLSRRLEKTRGLMRMEGFAGRNEYGM